MSAYTSFISDVHKSYRVEKLVLHHLIFLPIKISIQIMNVNECNGPVKDGMFQSIFHLMKIFLPLHE